MSLDARDPHTIDAFPGGPNRTWSSPFCTRTDSASRACSRACACAWSSSLRSAARSCLPVAPPAVSAATSACRRALVAFNEGGGVGGPGCE